MTEPHLDLDVLADLLVGEGADAEVEHVSRCAGCAARLAELDAAQEPVAAALAALPAPVLPRGVADRLSAALAAAGPLPAVEPERQGGGLTAVPPPDEREELEPPAPTREAARTVTPLGSARTARRTWLPAAAVAVLVLSAGGLALSSLPSGTGSDEDTAATTSDAAGGGSAGAESLDTGLRRNDSGTDYAAPDAFDRLLPDVLEGRAGRDPAAATAPLPASPEAPAAPDAPAAESDMSLSSVAALDRLRDPAALQACLSALVPPDGSVQPLAVDFAAYAGQPALVVVLSSSDPGALDVYVVGEGCAPGDDSTLFFTRVDRPS